MTLKLNLGCGRVIFPLDRDNIPYGNNLKPLPDTCFEPEWVNVDRVPLEGVNETLDLFRFPWIRSSNGLPFAENSVSEIWAAHLIEHIPHKVFSHNAETRRDFGWLNSMYSNPVIDNSARLCNTLDGFFVFFAECWRVLEPGGLIHIRAPLGTSVGGITDPTHRRFLTPGTFGYLLGQDDADKAPFDYALPFRFAMNENVTYRFREPYHNTLKHYTEEGLGELMTQYNNVVDEFRLVLRAVK